MVDAAMVRKVAAIARLELTDQEVERMRKDLSDVLDAFAILDQAPPAEPAFQPLNLKNVTRKDEVEPSLPRTQALMNTKNTKDGYFLGPAVL